MLENNPKKNIATVQRFGNTDGVYIPSDVKRDMGTEPGKQVKFKQIAPGRWEMFIVKMFVSEEMQPA